MKLIDWFKTLRHIVANYGSDRGELYRHIDTTNQRITGVEQRMVACTTVSADISASIRDRSQVVLIGRYRNQDYVEIVDLGPGEFSDIVERVRAIRRHGREGRFDVPHGARYVFDRLP